MNAVEELFDLGLTDELEDSDELVEGCDAISSNLTDSACLGNYHI